MDRSDLSRATTRLRQAYRQRNLRLPLRRSRHPRRPHFKNFFTNFMALEIGKLRHCHAVGLAKTRIRLNRSRMNFTETLTRDSSL